MSERCGQVATAIVQSVTPRLPDLHRKITAAELVLCKTFENILVSIRVSTLRAVHLFGIYPFKELNFSRKPSQSAGELYLAFEIHCSIFVLFVLIAQYVDRI